MNSRTTDFSSNKDKPSLSLADWFSKKWLAAAYGSAKWIYIFYPISFVFWILSSARKLYLNYFDQNHFGVPVIVVGNITLGGTGKTPLLIALVKHFQSCGKKVGVVSRGYGGKAEAYPCVLNSNSSVSQVGDEPLMIFKQTSATVCVGPGRVASCKVLVDAGCEIILSDDGLQHYALVRDIEILVIDAARQFGNQQLIPCGPLRESIQRTATVDFIFLNETQGESPSLKNRLTRSLNRETVVSFNLAPQHFVQIKTGKILTLNEFISREAAAETEVYLVAGIGNPEGFYYSLNQLGICGKTQSFPDHHAFDVSDFQQFGNALVIMTEKDAVKIQEFAQPNWYYLQSGVSLNPQFFKLLDQKVDSLKN